MSQQQDLQLTQGVAPGPPTRQVFGFRFSATAPSSTEQALLDRLLVDLPVTEGDASLHYEIVAIQGGFGILRNRQPWQPETTLAGCVQRLLDDVTDRAVENAVASGRVVAHAGVVSRAGGAVVLPAASGTGKTTLVLTLLANYGFAFLTDEAASLDPSTGTVAGLLRPPNLKVGSQARWPHLDPAFHGLIALPSGAWLVPAHVGGWQVDGGERPIRYLLFPERMSEPGPVAITDIRSAEAAVRLGEQTSFLRTMPRALEKLRLLVLAAPAAVLRYHDANEGAAAMSALLDADD